jgi:hypothetical protein
MIQAGVDVLPSVVASGGMGERMAEANTAVALLANGAATAGGLSALIVSLGPISALTSIRR